MTQEQADTLIQLLQQQHDDNQASALVASHALGYTMHLHSLLCWVVWLIVIFGLCIIGMLRPRRLTSGSD